MAGQQGRKPCRQGQLRPAPIGLTRIGLALIALLLAVACRGADRPHAATAASFTIELEPSGETVRGLAGDGAGLFVARGDALHSEIARLASPGGEVAWSVPLPGSAGSLAAIPGAVVVAISATGALVDPAVGARVTLHGEPSGLVVALDAATGKPRWRVPVDGTEFAVITSIAAIADPAPGARVSVVVGGVFSGTIRIGDAVNTGRTAAEIGRTVVSSGGRTDGFVAALASDGTVLWVDRVGGPGADAVEGVAARGDRIAIAGMFAGGAELMGEVLPAFDERLPFADGFVAELDLAGARRWAQTFGGQADDAVAGVAIDREQRVAVAATLRTTFKLGDRQLDVSGAADGLVAWYSPGGELGAATLIGGNDFDGVRAITAVDDRVVVAGFFRGALTLGKRALDAGGGDDSFIVTVTPSGQLEQSWHIAGTGREEVTALAAIPGGFIAGIAHTAALQIDDATLAARSDGSGGAAVIARPAP